jgi:hypothetical protein
VKRLAGVLLGGMVCLTAPDGTAIYLDKGSIVSLFKSVDCAKGASTRATLVNGTSVCVQETQKTIVKKVEDK